MLETFQQKWEMQRTLATCWVGKIQAVVLGINQQTACSCGQLLLLRTGPYRRD